MTSVTQADFARRRGVSRKTVTIWKQSGSIVIDLHGRVDVEASEALLADRPATYRGGVSSESVVEPEAVSDHGDLPEQDAFGPSSDNLTLAAAVRRKENFLGLLRKQEFEIAQREWVRVEEVGAVVEREYATVRERLLTIPGKIASSLVDADRSTIEATIRREITEALHELHDPAGLAGRVGSVVEAEAGAIGAEAASDPQPDRVGRRVPKGGK